MNSNVKKLGNFITIITIITMFLSTALGLLSIFGAIACCIHGFILIGILLLIMGFMFLGRTIEMFRWLFLGKK